jgi:lysophospholipase L1-like esterase
MRCFRGSGWFVGLAALLVGAALAQPAYDPAADAARKAAMTADELAWETLLEENLGDFYLPRYKVDKFAGRTTAWDHVWDDPKLPRVLLIGDSISRGYTLPVREALAGRANVHRAPANCGSTTKGLRKLDTWLGDGHWDVIHFNFGIHDRNLPPETYAANLEGIIASLQTTGATLIWARTTPPATADNAEKFSPAQCEAVNRVADDIMKKHGIAVNDLCTPVESRLADLQVRNNVHFNAEGYDFLGRKVAAAILDRLTQHSL